MKRLLAVAAVAISMNAMAYQARCYIDLPGQPSVVVTGEVTEFKDGIVEIKTPFRTYRTHLARVVIIKDGK